MSRRKLMGFVSLSMVLLLALVAASVLVTRGAFARPLQSVSRQSKARSQRLNVVGSTTTCTPKQWAGVSSPNEGTGVNGLNAVAIVPGTTQQWAVGFYHDATTNFDQTLTEYFDGSQWTIVPSPLYPTGASNVDSHLEAVSAITATDVWAIGYSRTTSTSQGIIEHWDGNRWSLVPSPDPTLSSFYGITAVADNDVWAVGSYFDNNVSLYRTLIEQWDGSAWKVVASPNASVNVHRLPQIAPSTRSGANELLGVTAVSANDVWAVGDDSGVTLTLHWDGSSWSIVTSPNVASVMNYLTGVAAVSSGDVMAVGYSGSTQTLAEHWNGTSWAIVSSGNVTGATAGYLRSITAVPGMNAYWAVGNYASFGAIPSHMPISAAAPTQFAGSATAATLTEFWNGSQWRVISSFNPTGTSQAALYGVAASSFGNVVAVGFWLSTAGGSDQTLAERPGPAICFARG